MQNNVSSLNNSQTKEFINRKPLIHKKLFNVTKEVDQIEKKGYNEHGQYYYVRAVDVIREVKKLLLKNSIGFTVNEIGIRRNEIGKNIHCEIESKATFFCLDNPEDKKEITYFSASSDRLDKDIFKAKTNGLKYMFIQEFLIDSDDGFTDVEKNNPLEKQKEEPEFIPNPNLKLPGNRRSGYSNQKSNYNNRKRNNYNRNNQNKQISVKQMNFINYLMDEVQDHCYSEAEVCSMSSSDASEVIGYLKNQARMKGIRI